jgi:nucleoid DNA-binding protein
MAKKKKVMTKAALYTELAERSGLKKTEISSVLDSLAAIAFEQLSPKGPGVFTLPGLARMKIREVKAVKGGVEKIKRSPQAQQGPRSAGQGIRRNAEVSDCTAERHRTPLITWA